MKIYKAENTFIRQDSYCGYWCRYVILIITVTIEKVCVFGICKQGFYRFDYPLNGLIKGYTKFRLVLIENTRFWLVIFFFYYRG